MKKLILNIIFLSFIVCLCTEEFTIFYFENIPYEYRENNKAKGINVDILSKIFEATDIEFKFIFAKSKDDAINQVKTGKADAIISLIKTQEGEDFLLFPEKSFSKKRIVIFAKEDYRKDIKEVDDLKGLTIGVSAGIKYGLPFDEYFECYRDYSDDQDTMVRKFANNRFSIFIANESIGHQILAKYNITNYKTLSFISNQEDLYVGISKQSEQSEDLLSLVNLTYQDLLENGIIDSLKNKYHLGG